MNQYTIKQSKAKRRMSDMFTIMSRLLQWLYRRFLFLARVTHRLRNWSEHKACKLLDESKGITFAIITAKLLDRNILRLTLIDKDSGKKYWCYHRGDYSDSYLKNKGGELEVIEEYYYLASANVDEWEVV